MPLQTQIIRDGQPLKIRWGQFHVAAMVIAAAADSGQGPWEDNSLSGIYRGVAPSPCPITPANAFEIAAYHVLATTPLNGGTYTLKHAYSFIDTADGEVFELREDDQLAAFRSH